MEDNIPNQEENNEVDNTILKEEINNNENNIQDNNNNKKFLNKRNIIIISIIAISILALIIYSILLSNKNNNNQNNTPINNTEEKKEETNNNIEKHELIVYYDQNKRLVKDNDLSKTYRGSIKISVESDDAEVLSTYGEYKSGYVLYNDNNKIKLYNSSDDTNQVLDQIKAKYNNYYFVNKNNNLLGVAFEQLNEDLSISSNCHYYDLKENKLKFDGHCAINFTDDLKYVETENNYKIDNKGNLTMNISVLNADTENVLVKLENVDICSNLYVKDNYIINVMHCPSSSEYARTYYTLEGKKITDEINTDNIDEYNGYVYYNDNNIVYKLDKTGNKTTIDKFKDYKLQLISQNYALAIKNDKLIMINLDDQNEYEITTWSDNYYLHTKISGYYENGRLTDYLKGPGHYIVVSIDKNNQYDGKAKEYYFNPNTKETISRDLESVGGYD